MITGGWLAIYGVRYEVRSGGGQVVTSGETANGRRGEAGMGETENWSPYLM